MIDWRIQRHALVALAAAALFGASAPFAKRLLGGVEPGMLAGLLYLGSGLGLLVLAFCRRAIGKASGEAPLERRDLPWLAGATLVGGIFAPVLFLWGLARTGAAASSLLLNFEGVLTALVAMAWFGEAVGPRVLAGTLVMVVAGTVLAWPGAGGLDASLPALAVVAACLCWGLDNNLTRRISGKDPVQIACTKGLVAGAVNFGIALGGGAAVPVGLTVGAALALGAVSYGLSLVLFVLALRHLGSARTGAHWSTAPFIGAAAAFALGESASAGTLIAFALMAVATWLVLTEHHAHEHTHERLVHSHRHVHDAHHQHAHRGDEGPEPHAHEHIHEPTTHAHGHVPDLHHRHGH